MGDWLSRWVTAPERLLAVTVVAFGVLVGCAIAAGELLALAERPNGSTSFDSSITNWVVAHRTHAVTTLARLFSTLGSQWVLTPVTALVTVLLVVRRRFVAAGFLVVTWGGAILLYNLIKHAVHRMRPPMDIWLTNVGRTTSFPSGHATQSMATFTALALVVGAWWPGARWPARVVAVVLALGVGWSRVYLGVHWTTDVVAGWLIAAAWVAITVWLARLATTVIQRRRERV